MSYTADIVAELDILMLYDLSTHQEGIKVHKNADPAAIAATQRLYEKGFITQVDGGYLTDLGIEAAELNQRLFTMLNEN